MKLNLKKKYTYLINKQLINKGTFLNKLFLV